MRTLDPLSVSHVVDGHPHGLLPAGNCATEDLRAHERRHGPLLSTNVTGSFGNGLLDAIVESGLRGRGGAQFPTARKLIAVRSAGRRTAVIANGTEGEPASFKDRVLLTRAPHLVLDGLSLLADLVGARDAVVVAHREAQDAVQDALAERRQAGVDRIAIRLVPAAPGFVSGEASAVVNWVDRSKPLPLGKFPRMSERGLHGHPTLVQNVETLAHVGLIARYGPTWFRSMGTERDPGSMLATVMGAVAHPGVYEVEAGIPFLRLLDCAGGTLGPQQAFLVGGYFGQWVAADVATAGDFSESSLGTGLGAGLVLALPTRACGVVETARLATYLASQSAGQCGPCVFGLPAIAGELTVLANKGPARMDRLHRWLAEVPGRGGCAHPDGVVRNVLSALTVFRDEVDAHLEGRCSATVDETNLLLPAEGMHHA